MKIEYLEQTTSTNDEIKRFLGGGENTIVCARRQTGGKGTKGRSFLSGEGGVYLSALTFYRDMPAENAFLVMTHAAVSVCRTAEFFGVAPQIKWPNDVLVGTQKLCGILIENGISEGKIAYSIAGIGLNASNDLSALGGIAVSLSEAAGRRVSVEEAREKLIENYAEEHTFQDYLSYVKFLGKEITVCEGEKTYRAVALNVLKDGRLAVKAGGRTLALSAAEISLRI